MNRRAGVLVAVVAAGLALGPAAAAAQQGFTNIIKERKEASGGGGGWGGGRVSVSRGSKTEFDTRILVYAAVGVGALIAIAAIRSRRAGRRAVQLAAAAAYDSGQSFRKQAVTLGFDTGEVRLLRKMAVRISPQMPANLLTTPSGREYLIGDLQHRAHQRQREVELLQQLYGKLGRISAQKIHERESVRVESDLPVWVVQRGADAAGADGLEGGDEVDPTAGQMLDISEGGAAIAVDLGAQRGDQIEFWSADSEVWIPPVMAGVVHVRPPQGESPPVLHLHFLDPPLSELRAAIQELQGRSERGYATE